jgi:ribonuclease HI
MNGSQKAGNPTQGASVMNPHAQTTSNIEIKSQSERHTINKAELAAITVALDLHTKSPQIRILTDISFCIHK